jgi:transposase
VKARIVAESFQPGARVVDVARRHGLVAHQLSDWRRHARQCLLAVPAEVLAGIAAPKIPEPMFVPLTVIPDPEPVPVSMRSADISADAAGIMTVELDGDMVVPVNGSLRSTDDTIAARPRGLS